MQELIYLGLGSNLGDRKKVLRKCRELLGEYNFSLTACSSLYETPPWGQTDQPGFINQVVAGEYPGTPLELLGVALDIERACGRVRLEHWGPRTLDIDVLLFGERTIQSQRLTVPHPYLHERGFVLVPLAELAPDLRLPHRDQTVQTALDALPESETEAIQRLPDAV